MKSSVLLIVLCAAAAFAQPPIQRSPLKINEIYYASSAGDQYIELYNPSATMPAFLDGMVIASFGGATTMNGPSINSQGLQGYKFPGRPGGRMYAVPPNGFVVVAINAQDYSSNGGLNLSGADWETFSGLALVEQDNPAPNLSPLGAGFFGIHLDFSMGKSDDAVVLCDGMDTTLTDGMAIMSIIDAVEYHMNASAGKLLPMQLDQGFAGVGILSGSSIERKTAGTDIDNSTIDFDTSKPSPGYEHGGVVQQQTIQPDIFPLSYRTYRLYDEYVTDSMGIADPTSIHQASLSIRDTATMIAGMMCATVVDSTQNQTGRPTARADHFINADGIDAMQYADNAFWSSYLGPAAQLISLPAQWIPLYKGSAGFRVSYPVVNVDTTVTAQGLSVAVKAQITGKWNGIDTITVPAGTFECYKCTITVHVNMTAVIITLMDATYDEQVWFARGIGIVKSSKPTVNVNVQGAPFSLPGAERQYRGDGVLGVHDAAAQPQNIFLSPAFPNPFARATSLTMALPSATHAALRLYDVQGKCVKTFADGLLPAGEQTFSVDGTELATGVYRMVVEAGKEKISRSLSVIK